MRRIMQMASEAANAAPTEGDATTQDTTSNNRTKVTTGGPSDGGKDQTQNAFAPNKSVRALARYLDVCLMRQRELRRAGIHHSRASPEDFSSASSSPLTSPVPQQFTQVIKPGSEDFKLSSIDIARGRELDPIFQGHRLNRKQAYVCIPGKELRAIPKESAYSSLPPPVLSRVPQVRSGSSLPERITSGKPRGTNCIDILCCCGLVSWCLRRLYVTCCCRGRRRCCCGSVRHSSSAHRIIPEDTRTHLSLTKIGIGNCVSQKVGSQSTPMKSPPNHSHSRAPTDYAGAINNRACCLCCRHQGNFLVRLHLAVKLMYLMNAFGQIFLTEHYTGVQYNLYGFRVLYDVARGRQWEETGHFPRVTFCDFEARKLAQSHYYTLQCVLPVNMFLEKIYIFLWLWFFVVGVITLISLIIWISRLGSRHCRLTWIQRQLITVRQLNRGTHSCSHFTENHLGPDGVFLLRLIAQNYGELVAGDVVSELWTAYWQRKAECYRPPPNERRSSDQPTRIHKPAPGIRQLAGPSVGIRERARADRSQRPIKRTAMQGRPQFGGFEDPRSGGERKVRNFNPTDYSATIMATEMLGPAERFAMPMMVAGRKPPSTPSQASSRYSSDSRGRDRSESPPPIPQRSTDGSVSDNRSIPELEQEVSSHSSGRAVSPVEGEEVEVRQESDVGEQEIQPHDVEDHDHPAGEQYNPVEEENAVGEYGAYDDDYGYDPQQDENIV
ncbi:unnamed protein product [Calicophoron daubneyi]|uniref:Innexin n=1 Tax=Calicophoron daubneyi TaxID=300641 RepID=A0AAV2TAR6_CALDB